MNPERFQARLLELLTEDPETAIARLREDPDADEVRAWLDAADPRMVGVAGALVRRWAVRDDPRG